MINELNINTGLLNWAIARSGKDETELFLKNPRIQDWLEGKKKPTFKQLQDFAKKVHVPFGYLFLQEPPKEKLTIPFFRTQKGKTQNVNINIFDTITELQRRQDWLREYLMDNEFEKIPFVGRYAEHDLVDEIVKDIRGTLGLDEAWAATYKTWEDALNNLSEKIEALGVIIIFNSVVINNSHRSIPVDECRGFVLVDDYAPFMFINAADAKAAQMFTIVHELAHIWTGKSAGFDFRNMQAADDPIERLCDGVAAEFLVPEKRMLEVWRNTQDFKQLAKYFKVSPIVVARRALDLQKITKAAFFQFYNNYISEISSKKEKASGGGDFYRTTRKRLSMTYAAHVNRAVKSGELLYNDAFRLTGLKGDTFRKFFDKNF
jgi:Zn-dependent peptidase ImmA (M78 family)